VLYEVSYLVGGYLKLLERFQIVIFLAYFSENVTFSIRTGFTVSCFEIV
jgi:hypothetical protein